MLWGGDVGVGLPLGAEPSYLSKDIFVDGMLCVGYNAGFGQGAVLHVRADTQAAVSGTV